MTRSWLACVLFFLSGCATYQSLPLDDGVAAADWRHLTIDARDMPLPALARHRFDPSDGLDMTEVAMLAVVNNPDLKLARALPSGRPVGDIAGTGGVHGVAFAQDLKRGYTSNGRDDSVTVFDLDTLKVRQVVRIAGHNPDAIVYEAASHKRLYLPTIVGGAFTVLVAVPK